MKVMDALNASNEDGPRVHRLPVDDVALFLCSRCEAYPVCFVCRDRHLLGAADHSNGAEDDPIEVDSGSNSVEGDDGPPSKTTPMIAPNLIRSNPAPLLFRCKRCKQACHYEHRELPSVFAWQSANASA